MGTDIIVQGTEITSDPKSHLEKLKEIRIAVIGKNLNNYEFFLNSFQHFDSL